MNELRDFNYIDDSFYKEVRNVLEEARKRVYRNIQSEMIFDRSVSPNKAIRVGWRKLVAERRKAWHDLYRLAD